MLTGEANSQCLRRPDKSVHNARGVHIDTNDDTARICPGCISEDGSRRVERRENDMAQQKGVGHCLRRDLEDDTTAVTITTIG